MINKQTRKRKHEELTLSCVIKILLVEDNLLNQKILTKLLSNLIEEVTIIIANNGQEAIDLYHASLDPNQTSTFQVILMDIEMPVKNGIEATKELCVFKNHPPIIGLSSADDQLKSQALAAGMQACYAKPYRKEDLLASIADSTMSSPANKKQQTSCNTNHSVTFFSSSLKSVKAEEQANIINVKLVGCKV